MGSPPAAAGGRALAVGSPALPPCSVHPPLPLGSFCSISSLPALGLTATLGPNAGRQRGSAVAGLLVCQEDWRCFTPLHWLLLFFPVCTSSGMFYTKEGSLLQLLLPGVQSLGPGAAASSSAPGRGRGQRLLHSRSNAVPTTSDPSPFPAPAAVLPLPDGDTGCSPLPCSRSTRAELAPCAPPPELPQGRRL